MSEKQGLLNHLREVSDNRNGKGRCRTRKNHIPTPTKDNKNSTPLPAFRGLQVSHLPRLQPCLQVLSAGPQFVCSGWCHLVSLRLSPAGRWGPGFRFLLPQREGEPRPTRAH